MATTLSASVSSADRQQGSATYIESAMPPECMLITGGNQRCAVSAGCHLGQSCEDVSCAGTGNNSGGEFLTASVGATSHAEEDIEGLAHARALAKGMVDNDDIGNGDSVVTSVVRSHTRQKSAREEFTGGHQVVPDGPFSPNLQCSICLQILRKPVQTSCGHLFCRSCLQPVLSGPDPRCPSDRRPLVGVFADRHCEREVNHIRVKCNNHEQCGWRGRLKDLEDHLRICEFQLISCTNPGCKKQIQRHDLVRHMDLACPHRLITCKFCKSPVPACDLSAHMHNDCKEKVVECTTRGCGQSMPRQALLLHLRNDCPAVEELCKLGCGEKVRRADFGQHCLDPTATAQHFSHMMAKMDAMQRQIAEKDSMIGEQRSEIIRLKDGFSERVSQGVAPLLTRLDSVECSLAQRESAVSHDARLEERLQAEINLIARDVKESALEQRGLKKSEKEATRICEELTKQVDRMDLRVMELETTNYSGFLIWKIANFSKLVATAEQGKKTSHYSPPFCMGRYGYKACARVYPNGDGAGHGQYISLFFVLMSGEHDALQQWPFQRRVTLTLLDQSPARRHISETFSPDPRSSSFQRPVSGLNVASGCPCFVSHNVLRSAAHKYLVDDTLFLKIKVDIANMEHVDSG